MKKLIQKQQAKKNKDFKTLSPETDNRKKLKDLYDASSLEGNRRIESLLEKYSL